jgi:CheY-like chemotaxis protein
VFTVTLPVEAPAEPASLPASQGSAAADGTAPVFGGPLVLVVDDDAYARDLMQRVLIGQGYRVELAAGGAQGIELARTLRPAVITLDVLMPGLDGWAVLSALKADPQTAEIPVIMVSVMDQDNLGVALGAAEYVVKPIDWGRFTALLERYRAAGRPARVLIVEDDLTTREMLCRAVEKQGWEVVAAANGLVALEAVAAQVPGLILLDLMMPELDGFGFMYELRKRALCRQVPVIVVTAKELTDEDRRRLNGQVIRVFAKGTYSVEELAREIRRALGGPTADMAKDI